ncbi:family A G protein-coupled receptor-like protein [Peniophora sp. CONT]|nr:family A G protein-coupled receptor-like protein [Peniophora sp. CONT]
MPFTDLSLRDSIHTNPNNAAIAQTRGSSDWLWAVFAALLLTDLAVIAFHFKVRGHSREIYELAIIILSTATLAYFSMASNLGSTPIAPEFHGLNGATRAIWYVRYIMWFICAPLLLLMVYIGTGYPLRGMYTALFMACFAVVCGLVGALVRTSYKWGYFVLGVAAMLYVIGHMWTARSVGFPSPTGRSRGAYRASIGALTLLALIYPIAWGLCEGGNRIGIVGEMIWYGILDLLVFSAFVPYFLWSHRNVMLGGSHHSNMSAGNGYPNTTTGNAYPHKGTEAGMTGHTTNNGMGAGNNGLATNSGLAPGGHVV